MNLKSEAQQCANGSCQSPSTFNQKIPPQVTYYYQQAPSTIIITQNVRPMTIRERFQNRPRLFAPIFGGGCTNVGCGN